MEILNIYTPEGGGEKLYSVSLDNEELRLYSEYQKEFGKFDASLAKMKELTKAELRGNRAGLKGTGTVHDIINTRGAYTGPDLLSLTKEKIRKNMGSGTFLSRLEPIEGYTARGIKDLNESNARLHKILKKELGSGSKAYQEGKKHRRNLMNKTKGGIEILSKSTDPKGNRDRLIREREYLKKYGSPK